MENFCLSHSWDGASVEIFMNKTKDWNAGLAEDLKDLKRSQVMLVLWLKCRSLNATGELSVKGFLRVW